MTDTPKPIMRAAFVSLAVALLGGCTEIHRVDFPEPLKIQKAQTTEEVRSLTGSDNTDSRREKLDYKSGPTPPLGSTVADPISSSTAPKLSGEPISAVFEAIRLPAFVNTVFGELLKVTYEIDSAVTGKEQVLVTMRTAAPLKPDDFYEMVTQVLGNYGISVVYSNNIYRIVEAASVKQQVPRIIRSRANANVPADMRPVFLFQPINSVAVTTMSVWLSMALRDRLQFTPLPSANGLMLLGSAEDVQAAVDLIRILDQPYLAGSTSLKISPAFWSAQKLSQQLVDILTAEGYSIGIGGATNNAIKLIPVESLNVIIAFGTGRETLEHTLKWAVELDQPSQRLGTNGVYYHQIYNAKAEDLAEIVSTILQETVTTTAAADQRGPATSTTSGKQKISVDEPRNALIFVGSAEEYAQFSSLITQMDRAPLEVMIEATVAEVTLKQGENIGLVFDYDDGRAAAQNRLAVKSDSAGLFFSLIRDRASIAARLNALADYNRLQILSTPRVVTSSGKAAAINVGTQVPIITTQEASPTGSIGGTSTILQSIQYRNTGVILNIEPIINSNRRVELTVSQEVSAAQTNNVSGVQSPLIATRSIQTTLSMNDGETVLLGGLIQENYSEGDSGIPVLKDLPWIGNLFKNQSRGTNTTELIILLTPYIIESAETSRQIRDAFQSKLGDWASGMIHDPKADAVPTTSPASP